MKDERQMTESELAKLNQPKCEPMFKVTQESIVSKPEVKVVVPAPVTNRHSNAYIALKQIEDNMAHQVEMGKYNLVRFAHDYLLRYIDDNYKNEIATDAEVTSTSPIK